MWMILDLKCPSLDMVEYQTQDSSTVEELREIFSTLTSAANTLTSENPLWEELAVLQNIQVKYKRILRCDKCLVHLHRVSQCLKKMVLLNLSKSYLDLAERFLSGLSMADLFPSVSLPSRQQLEFVLIRTLSAAKLVCDGIRYSRETFCFLLQKIKVGHTILDLVVATSVTARLMVLLKGTLQQMGSIYTQVLEWQHKLRAGAHQWPEKLNLPQDLKTWLSTTESGILNPPSMSAEDMQMFSSILKNSKDNSKADCSDTESIILVDEVQNTSTTDADTDCSAVSRAQNSAGGNEVLNNASQQTIQNGGSHEDYGEVIPRNSNKKSRPLKREQRDLLLKILHVQNLEDLKRTWSDVNDFPADSLPRPLCMERWEASNALFQQLKILLTKWKKKKRLRPPAVLKGALSVLARRLGFGLDQIEACRSEPTVVFSGADAALEPVRTLKGLRGLFDRLHSVLEFAQDPAGQRKLRKIFKRRRNDIRLLRQNGERVTARKMIFCTSKVLLTLFQAK